MHSIDGFLTAFIYHTDSKSLDIVKNQLKHRIYPISCKY
uniref:Bm14178 n=1 Tax=Brugia malayi TaxID=6279 RepID=A0A1I9G1G6_BRUMA|nr:Bm14178 [Brugia malayi]